MSSSLVLEAWLTMAWLTFEVFSDGWLILAVAVALAGLVARLGWSDFVGEDGVVVLMELLVALMAGKQPKGVKMAVEEFLVADAVSMGIFAMVSSTTLVLTLGSSCLRESLLGPVKFFMPFCISWRIFSCDSEVHGNKAGLSDGWLVSVSVVGLSTVS